MLVRESAGKSLTRHNVHMYNQPLIWNQAYMPITFGWRMENVISISLNAFSSVVLRKILTATCFFANVASCTVDVAPSPITFPRLIFAGFVSTRRHRAPGARWTLTLETSPSLMRPPPDAEIAVDSNDMTCLKFVRSSGFLCQQEVMRKLRPGFQFERIGGRCPFSAISSPSFIGLPLSSLEYGMPCIGGYRV